MGKGSRRKKSKVPVIGEKEYAAYIDLLKSDGGNGDATYAKSENESFCKSLNGLKK